MPTKLKGLNVSIFFDADGTFKFPGLSLETNKEMVEWNGCRLYITLPVTSRLQKAKY